MSEIINDPEIQKSVTTYRPGELLFLEGDDSRDLFILVSGRLEVLKDDKKISEIIEPGAMIGEMSFLLGSRRTATVRAVGEVRAIRIPCDEIDTFLRNYPSLAPRITQGLAQRLQETTRVMHGFKEFCDQLPDAVIMTDRNRNILAWNRAAEKLHGRTWQQMKGESLAEVYRDPEVYQQFIEDIIGGRSLNEQVLAIQHPDKGEHYVSTSTTVLYDGHHNVEGFLFLGRDVTRIKILERKYERIRRWLIPSFVAIGLLLAALFFSLPYFSKGVRILDHKKQSFRDKISADYRQLRTEISTLPAGNDQQGDQQILQQYFNGNDARYYCIKGLVLLDQDKKVVTAYAPRAADRSASLIGTTYSGIKFRGPEKAPARLLSLFRTDKEHPMGMKGVEIAFDLRLPPDRPGWLLFQLDSDKLEQEFGLDEDILASIDFPGPRD
jgi:PAS domain S-box-containing protein